MISTGRPHRHRKAATAMFLFADRAGHTALTPYRPQTMPPGWLVVMRDGLGVVIQCGGFGVDLGASRDLKRLDDPQEIIVTVVGSCPLVVTVDAWTPDLPRVQPVRPERLSTIRSGHSSLG